MRLRFSSLLMLCGIIGMIAAAILWHLAESRMGVMRDLHVRNIPLTAVLFSPISAWGLRIAVGFGLLLILRTRQEQRTTAIAGSIISLCWIGLSFAPQLLGLATPWMMLAMGICLIGILVRSDTANALLCFSFTMLAVASLYYLAESHMGEIQQADIFGFPLETYLFYPLAIWILRTAILIGFLLIAGSSQKRRTIIMGGVIALYSIWLSFIPETIGIAAPWVLLGLSLFMAGLVLRTVPIKSR